MPPASCMSRVWSLRLGSTIAHFKEALAIERAMCEGLCVTTVRQAACARIRYTHHARRDRSVNVFAEEIGGKVWVDSRSLSGCKCRGRVQRGARDAASDRAWSDAR